MNYTLPVLSQIQFIWYCDKKKGILNVATCKTIISHFSNDKLLLNRIDVHRYIDGRNGGTVIICIVL